jgi:hypothetical protein
MGVQFNPAQPQIKGLAEQLGGVVLTWKDGGHPGDFPAITAALIGHVSIELCGDAGFMGVLEGDDVPQAVPQEEVEDLPGCHPVADGPGIFVEPLPDGAEEMGGKDMYMGVHHGVQPERQLIAFPSSIDGISGFSMVTAHFCPTGRVDGTLSRQSLDNPAKLEFVRGMSFGRTPESSDAGMTKTIHFANPSSP